MYRKYTQPAFRPKRAEMLLTIERTIPPVKETEVLAFDVCEGRVAAEDVAAVNTLPNRAASRFDGIGVRYAAFEGGPPDTAGWKQGEDYVFCNTGIAIPGGFDTVIAIEDVDIEQGVLSIHEPPAKKGQYVTKAGEQMAAGECLIRKGQVIAPAHVGLFASGGVGEVSVFKTPKVAILPTGGELVPPTDKVPPGKNVQSNSYMIAAYLHRWGAESETFPITKDDPALLTAAVEKALQKADLVIVIAGSSLGTEDYTLQVLSALGEVVVPELAHGPGRKSSLSMVAGKPVFGVAGPPFGAQITCELYLHSVVRALRGQPPHQMQEIEVTTDDAFVEHDVDFCERVHIYKAADGYHIRSVFALHTTRAQTQFLANGNFYRDAHTSCRPGDRTTVELLVPREYIPGEDLTKKR